MTRDKRSSLARTAAIVISCVLCLPASAGEAVTGRASIVDADTIDIGKIRIRFADIDAMESDQLCTDARGKRYLCGEEAANALADFLAKSRPTTCTLIRREDGYEGKRWVGECRRADGESINTWLVANGLALDWPRFSRGKYADIEASAAAKSIGVWRGGFEQPCLYRAHQKKHKPRCD
jgi:endonuclease YncB( thermonuclease family)